MTGRKCSTCKHFEAAPIWRKGWCRNPLLYSPQQSHLVGEDDLDCERGMGNYWEAGFGQPAGERLPDAVPVPTTPARQLPVVTQSGQQIFVVSGSSGYGGDQNQEPPPPTSGRGGSGSGGGGGSLSYYPEERYWTDYLRIAAPILGVLLLVVLFWLWASSFLGDDDDNNATADATGTTTLPTIGPTATQGAGSTPGAGTPTSPIVITTVTPQTGATNTPGNGGTTPTDTPEPEPPADIFPGATVVIANTGGDGVNLRSEPTSASEVIAVLLDGTVLTVTGDAAEGDGLVWWPVSGEFGDGWVAQDFLEVSQ